MTRSDFIKDLASNLQVDITLLEEGLERSYNRFKRTCCDKIIEEALDSYTTEEYRAGRATLEYFILGEK